MSTATFNIAIGIRSLYNNLTGGGNIAIGYMAGYNSRGTNNIIIGCGAATLAFTSTNSVTLGNASIATIRAQVTTITALSDCRDKTNIQGIPVGLDLIKSVRPVKFMWNMRDGAKVGIEEHGFIAQELDEVQKTHNAEWLNLVLKDNPDRLEATPGKLLPVMIKAIQELEEKVAALAIQANTNDVGYTNIPQNSQSATYTTVLSDAGKYIYHPPTDANARTYIIAANSSVAYPIGTEIRFVNMSSQAITIAINSDTMYLGNLGTTGDRTLGQYGVANALKISSTTWIITGTALT
jgi:hypothetical protein